MPFDPFGMLTRRFPEQTLHRAITVTMVLILACFFLHRLLEYQKYAVKLLWLSESLLYLVLITAFLVRTPPLSRSIGLREIIVPLVGSMLPFALLLSPPAPGVVTTPPLLFGVLWVMTAGTLLTIGGMWCLRRGFSITVEARTVVSSGPYRFLRHPIYTGEIIAAASVAVIRYSPLNLLLLLLFIMIQLLRARWEEQKLAKVLPRYREFARNSRWLWSSGQENDRAQ